MEDRRNLTDELKGLENAEVKAQLSLRRLSLEVAIENVEHDFNIGTVVRNANNFNVAKVHIVGKKKYNRRGAMCTDKYLEIIHWQDVTDFIKDQKVRKRELVAIENNTPRAKKLGKKQFNPDTTLVFGSEGDGLTDELLVAADDVRMIESFGSTRSINVGVASGIAMYEWVRQNVLEKENAA